MAVIDLAKQSWILCAWRPYTWKLVKKAEAGWLLGADRGPYPALVPGSVQETLRRAGVIPDWNVGLNSLACEWVEHRHWDFATELAADLFRDGERVVFSAEGLDHAGWIVIDGEERCRFEGALIPHRFDVTPWLNDGKAHQFSIIFDESPQEQGQIGYTSRSRFFKPRYNYSWDWCPRIVPIGIAGALTLHTGDSARYTLDRVTSTLEEGFSSGTVSVQVSKEPAESESEATVVVRVIEGDREIGYASAPMTERKTAVAVDGLVVEPWWPNGMGTQNLYTVVVEVSGRGGTCVWSREVTVGFKHVTWQSCEGASPEAEPWICVVNGKPVFLQGANWVPPRALYPDATAAEYERLITLYRDMGCTVLRVWGGAILETETFYTLCDRAGILVWQEFPLSSSGVENYPPDDPVAIDTFLKVAATYIQRRSHHASLLLWCGGNELTQGENGERMGIKPIGYEHPCIAALRDLVAGEDPEHRFIPTSPSGPRFGGESAYVGKGLHHDVHGPWGMGGFSDIEAWRTYWETDDALFRSEVGMPGACDVGLLQRYAGRESLWPPQGAYWMHTAAWWTQRDRYKADLESLPEEMALSEYVRRTQEHQAAAYAIAARTCKTRFPRCGGFIIWMGHDLFPCPANNSVIDFEQRPKPAYYALLNVFKNSEG